MSGQTGSRSRTQLKHATTLQEQLPRTSGQDRSHVLYKESDAKSRVKTGHGYVGQSRTFTSGCAWSNFLTTWLVWVGLLSCSDLTVTEAGTATEWRDGRRNSSGTVTYCSPVSRPLIFTSSPDLYTHIHPREEVLTHSLERHMM